MNHRNKLFLLLLSCLISSLNAFAEESPSKQINAIIRGGEHVYAEATAENEGDAKKSCEELIKVEISKYLAEKNGTSDKQKVIRTLDYDTQVITVPRKTKVRVFMYISKDQIDQRQNESPKESVPTPTVNTEPNKTVAKPPVKADETPYTEPTKSVEPTTPAASINISSNELAQWQIDVLNSIISQGSMSQVKNRLNSYKAQYKVKRIGDNNTKPTRVTSTFYAIFDADGNIIALLAPSDEYHHYDYISSTTINMADYLSNKHIWFELSK